MGLSWFGDQAPLCGSAVRIVLGEGGGDEGGDDAPALLAGMGQQVAHEVDAAPLSSCAEDPGRGSLQTLVVVGDHQLHAAQAAPGGAAQELGPEGLGLGRADRHAQDLAPSLVVDRDHDCHRDRYDAPGLAHLHIGRIQPEIGPVALQRPVEKAADLVVDLAAQPGDLALGDARHPHRLHQVVEEFIRRFLLHVLPDGMHRIRYFGILANGCRARTLERAREALGSVGCAIPGKTAEGLEAGHDRDREREPEVTTPPVACSHCGGVLRLIREIPRRQEPLSTRGPPDVPPPRGAGP